MLSQLRAALAVEEAGKPEALQQLRAAHSRAAQLEVCSLPTLVATGNARVLQEALYTCIHACMHVGATQKAG